jgi:hypothetical protein
MSEEWGISRVGKLDVEVGETLQGSDYSASNLAATAPRVDGLLPADASSASSDHNRNRIPPRQD